METTVYNKSRDFWNTYRKGRPKIPASFYDRFYTYHASHNGSFGTVHDVGAGYGLYSLTLAERFSHVIVSDAGEKNVEVARNLLQPGTPDSPSKFTFLHEPAEKSTVTDSAVDAVFMCNALHFTHPSDALSCFSRQLKSGGTLFIAHNGICKFDYPPALQQAWYDMMDVGMHKTIHSIPEGRRNAMFGVEGSGYDFVEIPGDQWENVKRVKLNTRGDPLAFALNLEGFRAKTGESKVAKGEVLDEDEVDEGWSFEADLELLRNIAWSYPLGATEEELAEHFRKIEGILKEAGGKAKARWNVSMIMATKR